MKTVSTSYQEDDVLTAFVSAPSNKVSKGLRVELSATFIKCHEEIVIGQIFQNGIRLLFLLIRSQPGTRAFWCRNNLPQSRIIIVDAFGEIGYARFHIRVVFFTNGPELNFHQ